MAAEAAHGGGRLDPNLTSESGQKNPWFNVRSDAGPYGSSPSIFEVGPENGFLPQVKPMEELPAEFSELEDLMKQIPTLLHQEDPDALAKRVRALPTYNIDRPEITSDANLMQTLMRDYSILVSTYLVEANVKSGKPRSRVPPNVSIPFERVCYHLDEPMIMAYDSYIGNNFKTVAKDPEAPDANCWHNLRLIRTFDGGPEEATFILAHLEIEAHSPKLIRAYNKLLAAVADDNLDLCRQGLEDLKHAQEQILVSQLKMFNASDPKHYARYVRPWIFGFRNNPDFPDGVTYEGCARPGPWFLSGETGAQSSIIPSQDIVLGISHRNDPLKKFLQDLEDYRPFPHRRYLRFLRQAFHTPPRHVHSRDPVDDDDETAGMAEGATHATHRLRALVARDKDLVKLHNECIRNVFYFRDTHVIFADLYVARYSSREGATGGTPFKAYLRKHRDESIRQQLQTFGDECIAEPGDGEFVSAASGDRYERDLRAAEEGEDGIPPLLSKLHEPLIEKHGGGDPSLTRKMYEDAVQMFGQVERHERGVHKL